MGAVVDPEQAHARAIRRLAGFDGRRVLEIGCGEGRLTYQLAGGAASWLATDPRAEAVTAARAGLPASLGDTVTFAVAGGADIEAPELDFDLVLFSWSL